MKKIIKAEYAVIFLLSLVGFYMRVYIIHHIPTTQLFDFSTYYEVANNVYQNLGFTLQGYPIAFQGMGYSTILGYWFKLFNDHSELCAKWLNVIMSMGTIYLVYYILHRLKTSTFVRVLATVMVIFLPHHIAYCNTIGTEVMSAFLLAGVIAIQVTPFNWKVKYPVLGIAVGIMALTKPFFLAYPLVLSLIAWLKDKEWKTALKLLVVVSVVMMIVVSPWTIRNYKKFGRFIPVSYNSGFNLYINNNPNNIHGGWQSFDDIYKTPELQEKIDQHLNNPLGSVKIASDIELDFKPEAQRWIKEHPIEFFKLGVIRVHSTYFAGAWDIEYWAMNDYRDQLLKERPEDDKAIARHFNFMKALYDIVLYVISSFGLIFIIANIGKVMQGIVVMKKRIHEKTSIVFLNLSYISLVYFVYEGQPRYNFIVLFLLIISFALILDAYRKQPIDS